MFFGVFSVSYIFIHKNVRNTKNTKKQLSNKDNFIKARGNKKTKKIETGRRTCFNLCREMEDSKDIRKKLKTVIKNTHGGFYLKQPPPVWRNWRKAKK